jgi:hypothetical protein
MPWVSPSSPLSVWAGACQPQGGVPRFLPAGVNLENLQSNQKKQQQEKFSWLQLDNQDSNRIEF